MTPQAARLVRGKEMCLGAVAEAEGREAAGVSHNLGRELSKWRIF